MESQETSLLRVIDQVVKEKNLDKSILVDALEAAMLTAAKKMMGIDTDLEAHFEEDLGEVEIYGFKTVADPVVNPAVEISFVDAKKLDPECQVGDSLGVKLDTTNFGRVAAQIAKQVIIQKVREAERENVYAEYQDRKDELITGVARRFERGNIIVDLGRAESILPLREQNPKENYRAGDRIQAYVLDVTKNNRGPQIILSRVNPKLIIKLFEVEVPEIHEGIVKIVNAARDPGRRSKIAVYSTDRDVDPVGTCVGLKGSRVQAIVQELRGEKIDIIQYNEDPARFVCNALAPAEVSKVLVDEASHTMEVIVPDEQLSLAIGKKGQNVRLASQLTGWRLDVISESKSHEIQDFAWANLSKLPKLNDILITTLFNYSIRGLDDLCKYTPEELASIPGVSVELATEIIHQAREILNTDRAEQNQEKQIARAKARIEAARLIRLYEQRPSIDETRYNWYFLRNINDESIEALIQAGIPTVEDLAKIQNPNEILQKLVSDQHSIEKDMLLCWYHQAKDFFPDNQGSSTGKM